MQPLQTRPSLLLAAAAAALVAASSTAAAQGDPTRGAKTYRACVACHSLEPGVHLTGPSLANLWGKKAGSIEDFGRYSKALVASGLVWDENTLNAWLAHTERLVPGTYMAIRGIENDRDRSDLVAFLRLALGPEGSRSVVTKGLVSAELAMGQVPDPVTSVAPAQQVVAIRHCRGTYFVTTADGVETPYWEMNVRLKTDTSRTGPEPGKPVLMRAGMMGDRVSIIFAEPAEIGAMVKSQC
jgi:cytochrome c